MNPVLSGIPNQAIQNMGQLKSLFRMIQAAGNPQAMLNQMIASNPRSKEIMDYINSFNGDYEKAFRTKANEMGIDPNDFLNNFK